MASFAFTTPVRASQDRLWTLVKDVRFVAGLFPFMRIDAYEETGAQACVFNREIRIPSIITLRWREETCVQDDHTVAFRAVDGDLQTFIGTWQVHEQTGKVALALALEYEVPAGLGAALPAAMIDFAMKELFRTICLKVKEAAEDTTP